MKKYDISVIIPTYNNVDYIDECLNSILKSKNKFITIEILVGIDSCVQTRNYIDENKNKYEDIRFFYFNKNVGPYVVKNTLVRLATSELFVFFDSDDFVLPDTLFRVLGSLKYNRYVQFKYKNFNENGIINKTPTSYAEGVIGIRKNVFLLLNGYYPWKCGADSELRFRYEHINKRKTNKLDTIVFYRRIHSNSLTQNDETGFKTVFRQNISNEIQRLKTKGYPNPEKLHIDEDFYEL